MPLSFALWLHLLLRRGGAPLRDAIARPPGESVCLHVDSASSALAATQLARMLLRLRPGLVIVVTGTLPAAGLPTEVVLSPPPGNSVSAARAFLAQWRPRLVLFVGALAPAEMPTALIVEAKASGAKLMLVDARFATSGGQTPLPRFWQRAILRDLLARFHEILVPDQASAAWLNRLGVARDTLQLGGSIREPVEPLPCTEAERAALARQLRSRPVWFAVSVPESEEATVLDAHEKALLRAHRMLLILLPERPERAASLVAAVEARGQRAARRSLEEEPEDDVQVLIVEDESELGLWYRLAPVTWMGGTLHKDDSARSPLEAAALGSAIVRGTAVAPHRDDYSRLSEAGACRVATSGAELGEIVAELIAPDKVAALAHNAWMVVSGDAGVAEQVAKQVLTTLDAKLERA